MTSKPPPRTGRDGAAGAALGDGTGQERGDSAGDSGPAGVGGTADADGADGARAAAGAGADASPGAKYADRCYRSPAALAGGVLLLLIGVWLAGDALFSGTGRTPWLTLAGLVFAVPLVVAFTLRPAVYAGEARLRIRNPFRTITVPWGTVETVRSGYSSELVADGTTYQLWSIPVSLRARSRATRQNERVRREAADPRRAGRRGRGAGAFAAMGGAGLPDAAAPSDGDKRAPSDQAVAEMRELARRHEQLPAAQGRVEVRWAYEIVLPALLGAAALAVLLATG